MLWGSCGGEAEPGPSAPEPPATCSKASQLEAGTKTVTLLHDGVERAYIVHVPGSYDGGLELPLVLDIHGWTGSATQQASSSGWREKADSEGFIVVHPEGLNGSWNAGELCCGQSLRDGVDDEGFILAIVDQLRDQACIDARRIYATGLSNGGAMSHLLACRHADLFAAAAPVSMGNGTIPCEPSRPIAITLVRGTGDAFVPYEGGGPLGPTLPSAQADFEQWRELDGCSGSPVPSHGLCQTYQNCEAGTEVTLCSVETAPGDPGTLGGHILYGPAREQGAAVADVAWEMFEAQLLPD